jgi:hypothetical protein
MARTQKLGVLGFSVYSGHVFRYLRPNHLGKRCRGEAAVGVMAQGLGGLT